jgi:multidrug resistance efflux pump
VMSEMTDSTKALIDRGLASKSKRTQALARKVTNDLRRLHALVQEDESKAEARAEVERLTQQLRAAKARLKGDAAEAGAVPAASSTTATNGTVSPTFNPVEIRAWAARNRVPIPTRGRVPASVIERYRREVAQS